MIGLLLREQLVVGAHSSTCHQMSWACLSLFLQSLKRILLRTFVTMYVVSILCISTCIREGVRLYSGVECNTVMMWCWLGALLK